jgi:hypothetical protein
MAVSAAYPRKVQIAPDAAGVAGTYADLGSQLKFDLDEKSDNVDVSQLNTAGYRLKLQTLLDSGVSIDVLYDPADTAQSSVRTGKSGRTQVWVKIFLQPANGVFVPMVVDDIKTSFDPAQPLKQSYSLSGNGAITTF